MQYVGGQYILNIYGKRRKSIFKNSMNGTTPRIIEKEWQELLTRMRDTWQFVSIVVMKRLFIMIEK